MLILFLHSPLVVELMSKSTQSMNYSILNTRWNVWVLSDIVLFSALICALTVPENDWALVRIRKLLSFSLTLSTTPVVNVNAGQCQHHSSNKKKQKIRDNGRAVPVERWPIRVTLVPYNSVGFLYCVYMADIVENEVACYGHNPKQSTQIWKRKMLGNESL